MATQFAVIDGADEGRIFPLNEGTVVIGNSRKNTDICLHDLLCSRVHCEVEVTGERVVVKDVEGSTGTLVNGQKVQTQELRPGDVVRVGNSFLRLQVGDMPKTQAEAEPSEPEPAAPPSEAAPAAKAPRLPFERLEELVGQTVAHYRLDGVAGRGHFGITFRAQDLKDDHVVALKLLHPAFPKGEDEMRRFVESLRIVLPLRHAHLVNVWSAGKARYCWIALQYVEGESVAGILARTQPDRRIDWQRGFRVAMHMARALDYIHRRQHFHGNVVPANILVQSSDRMAKLGGLMLGKALEGAAVQQLVLENKLLAELPYLPPEQVRGDASVGPLSDIYSLGAVTYHLLTGKPPFKAESIEDTIALIQEAELVRPRKLQKSIPEQLDKIVVRMLARQQEERYQTAIELLNDLQRVADEEEVTTV
jgi:serine/threonine-protein kinase